MHVSFNSHNSKMNSSSKGIFEYLSKENNLENFFSLNNENFFSNDFNISSNNGSNYLTEDIVKLIDDNISTNHEKNKESNYFVLNIAPSQNELKHLEKKAIEILKENDIFLLEHSTEEEQKFYEEQKNITLDILLKDYTDSIMDSYAEKMNREVYVDTNNLPNERANKNLNKQINSEFNNILFEKGVLKNEEKEFIKFEKFEIKSDLDKGKIFTIYSDELKKEIDLFIPSQSFNDDNSILSIDKEYYLDKIEDIVFNEEQLKNEIIIDNDLIVKADDDTLFLKKYDDKLKIEIELNFSNDDFKLDVNNNYVLKESVYNEKYNQEFLKSAKEIFNKDYMKIQNDVINRNTNKSNNIQTKIINSEFKELLINKNLIENKNDHQFKIEANVIKQNKESTLISVQSPDKKSEVRLWVNNNSISSINKNNNEILFKNQRQIERLIEKANVRDLKDKELTEIKFKSKETISEKIKGETKVQKVVVFKQEHQGLKEPLIIKVLEKDLVKENGKYLIPKYQLEHKIKIEVNKGINKEYSSVKSELKNRIWRENGFNPETRKMTKNDLLYFGKVENNRTYKGSNKLDRTKIETNRKILEKIKEIKLANGGKENSKTEKLKLQLIKDKHTGEVIKEGVVKGGNQKHVHVVVSRYDNMNPKHLKKSLSPVTNHRGNGESKGFNRHEFFKSVEKVFDNRYSYDRPKEQTYEYRNDLSKQLVGNVKGQVKGKVMQEVKSLLKEGGITNPIDQVKQEYNPIQKLKQELQFFPLPTSLPKTKLDLVIKIGKFMMQSIDKGLKM